MLALSTSCAPPTLPLDRALSAFRHFRIGVAVLHRAPEDGESAGMAALAGRIRVAALFGESPRSTAGAGLLVVEGGPAAKERERSLDALCRRLHALRGYRVALRTPATAEEHPSAAEIPLVCEAVRHAGYWHDLGRGGEGYLDAAERHLLGASFDPRRDERLLALRDALPAAALATVWLPAGTARPEVAVALDRARAIFRS